MSIVLTKSNPVIKKTSVPGLFAEVRVVTASYEEEGIPKHIPIGESVRRYFVYADHAHPGAEYVSVLNPKTFYVERKPIVVIPIDEFVTSHAVPTKNLYTTSP